MERYLIIRCYIEGTEYVTVTEYVAELDSALHAAAIYISCPDMEAITIRDTWKDPMTRDYTILEWMHD